MSDHAALLRRAATKARETAQAATSGPWTAEEHHTPEKRLKKLITLDGSPPKSFWAAEVHPVVELEGNGEGGARTAADAHHIALWHPGVALAVADLLESEATHHADDPSFERGSDPLCDTWPHAVGIARALLGEDTE